MAGLNKKDKEAIVKNVCSKIDSEKIIIFGSMASDDTTVDSDLDLMIIDHNEFNKERNRRKELKKLREALSFIKMPKDILLYSKGEMEYWKDSVNHIISRSLTEGFILYERYYPY